MNQNIVAFRSPVQALIFTDVLVPELTKGHWGKAYPVGHAKDWSEATPVVDEKSVGVGFEAIKDNYDLLNKDFVDAVAQKALKRIKSKLGDELTVRDFRAQLKDMMFIMRTPKGKPLATSHQGMMARPGRPSKTDLETILSAARSKAAKPAKPKDVVGQSTAERRKAGLAKARQVKAAKKASAQQAAA